MKKFIITLVLVLAVSVAFAGDGPFPKKALVGTYQSPVATVVLNTGLQDSNKIQVFIKLENQAGQVIAQGSTMHSLSDSLLVIPLQDIRGRAGVFMAIARLNGNANSRSNSGIRLQVRVDLGNGEIPKNLVLDRIP